MNVFVTAALAVMLGVPGRTNATATIAAVDGFVVVGWGATTPGGVTDVYCAVSRDSGRSFAAPARVNDVDGDARLSGEQPPHVSLIARAGREPAIAVVWTTKGTTGTRLVQARSDDGGRSFGKAVTVPGSDAAGNRGWEATAVGPGGRLDVVWLDHRELASDSTVAHAHHDHARSAGEEHDGVAMAQKSKLYFAPLDASREARAVTGGVCYCCKTALAVGADGSLYAAWRHVYQGNLRDIAFTVSRDGGRTFAPPVRVSEDKWMLDGCPDDGPAMAVDARTRIHIVWPTLVSESSESQPTIAVFYAVSKDGRRFSPRERLPTSGTAHHPQLAAVSDGSLIAAWDETVHGARRIVTALITADEDGRARVARDGSEPAGVYPVLAVAREGVIAAWTAGAAGASTIHVEPLRPNRYGSKGAP